MKRSISPETRKAIRNDLIVDPAQMNTAIARRHKVSHDLVDRLRKSLGFRPSKEYRAEKIRATMAENPDASESKLAYLCKCSVDLIRKVKSLDLRERGISVVSNGSDLSAKI